MNNIDREKAQEEFDRLLRIVDEAKGKNDPEVIEKAARESFAFFSKLSGSVIAKWVMHEAQQPLPKMHHIKSDEAAPIDSSSYVKRGLARIILAMPDVLDAAYMSPEVLARDLIEMSHENGSKPVLLSLAEKGKGHKDNRDLKHAAKKRIAYVVYYEAGRENKAVKVMFHELNRTSSGAMQGDDKTWDRIAANLSPDERSAATKEGKAATSPHPDASRFQELWKMAIM